MGFPQRRSADWTDTTAAVPASATITPLSSYRNAWVFDFDGTLIDSMGAFATLAGEIIATRYGITPATAEQQYRQTSGLPFVQQLAALYPCDPRNADAVDEFERRKKDLFFTALPFPDTMDLLVVLKRRGDFIAVSSNNFQDLVEQRVRELRFPIDLVCGWDNEQGKGRAHFDAVVRKSRVAWQRVMFVGDSLHDAQIAEHCQVNFTGRAGTFSAQEFRAAHPRFPVVHDLSELMR